MITNNCSKSELKKQLFGKRVVLFGCGKALTNAIKTSIFENIDIVYLIDNNQCGQKVNILGREYRIYSPEKIKEEKTCTIIIMSSRFHLEMYQQLVEMCLPDEIECYIYPMIRISNFTIPQIDEHIKLLNGNKRIPKVIHSFWFSGERLPEIYEKCMDSWKRICPDFEIKIWTSSEYDITKNSFMINAYEKKKWAFVADYARLDVVNNYGGIYMDLDVELKKSPEEIMCHDAIFSFNMVDHIDLAMFASTANNSILTKLMKLYDNERFDSDKDTMERIAQPGFIENALIEEGVRMTGQIQWIDDIVFLPKTYIMPLDMFTYLPQAQSEYTYAIHWCNGGWRDEKSTPEQVKQNRKLWELFNSRERYNV